MASGYRGSVIDSVRRLYGTGTGTVAALGEAQLLERFAVRGDAAAFEAILVRHGPMVLGVCRRVLDDPHDVDDAFQATFLVLIRKAGSIRDRDVLGTWLHGVARRVAVRARVNARRRGVRERTGGSAIESEDRRGDRAEAGELRELIDAELGRLPERYRAPVVLCDLEGQTYEQAAEQLRCPVGTVKSRLSRGRERLRDRLARRGVTSATAAHASTTIAGTAGPLPADRMDATMRTAARFAAAPADPAGTSSAAVASLAKGVLGSMALSKLKLAAAALLVVLAVAGTWTLVVRMAPAEQARVDPARGTGNAATPVTASAQPARAGAPAPSEAAVQRFTLENGLEVILRPIRGARQTALVVLYSIGNDHDPQGQSGLGHMVEHLYVTAAAGDEEARTADAFARRYPDGANGQTGDRYTVIATSFSEKDLQKEVRDAAARMAILRITPADLERELPRLAMEVDNMFGAFPALAAQNNARELVRPTPRGGRRGGLPEAVGGLTPETVRTHWERYYKPRNAIVSLAGAIDPAAAREAITTHFGKIAAGEPVPAPGDPGRAKTGTVSELTVKSRIPGGGPTACLAFAAPQPDSDLYAPFLVLISRLWAGAGRLGGSATAFPIYFTPLDDGAIVAVSTPARPGESSQAAFARLESFVAETIGPKLRDGEVAAAREQLSFFLGLGEIPDVVLAQNPYGVAFSLGRRAQLGIDPARLGQQLNAIGDKDLRRVADEVFAPTQHVSVFIAVEFGQPGFLSR